MVQENCKKPEPKGEEKILGIIAFDFNYNVS